MNTAGHKKGNMYEFYFNDMNGQPVEIEGVEGSFNGTLMNTGTKGHLMAFLDEDYLGELLQVQFKYPDVADKNPGKFEIATAFRSIVMDSTP